MTDFLNLSLFEMLINSNLIQNSGHPIVITYILSVLRTCMIWPLIYFFYRISKVLTYHFDRNKANSYNLRSSRVKRFCYQDFWRDYWECNGAIHGMVPSLYYECDDCKACNKGDARCKSIQEGFQKTRAFFFSCLTIGVILAILLCNPIITLKVLGAKLGVSAIVVAIFVNPLFVWLSRFPFYFETEGTIIKPTYKKHSNPYATIYEEMKKDGALRRYYDEKVPAGCKRVDPNAISPSHNWNQAYEYAVTQHHNAEVIRSELSRQRLSNNANNPYGRWWWL